MARISGHYEWDDDELTPGQRKGGGLHQNLFNGEGKLRGNARFVPDDEGEFDSEPLVITETIYVPIEQRRRTQEEEFEKLIADIVSHLIDRGVAKAKPLAERLWRERAAPAVDARRAKIVEQRARRKAKKNGSAVEATVDQSPHDLHGLDGRRPDMSSAEAQARTLAALAARAYSDEQMRLVASANIVDGDEPAELNHSLAELPIAQLKSLLEAMATDPSLLSEANLANLASILGRRNRLEPSESNHR